MRKIIKKYKIIDEKNIVEISKPTIKPGESEDDYVSRCIPWVISNEGATPEQAAGKCHGMFRNKKMEKFEENVNKYSINVYNSPDDFTIDNIEIKKGQELHYILGVVLEPDTVDATRTEDTIGDIYNEDEVRKAAHYFLANYNGKGNDFMHSGEDNEKLKIVESYISQTDMELNGQTVKKGSWLMGTLVLDNEIWDKVKKGEITGYSIGGTSNAKIETT